MGCSEYICRAIQLGIYENPNGLFLPGAGIEHSEIPQIEEARLSSVTNLIEGCEPSISHDISPDRAAQAK